jgi:hypothetical protein
MAIRVEFIGICTHIREVEGLAVPHRVVLVNAREETSFKDKGKIPPHDTLLRIRGVRGAAQLPNGAEPWVSWSLEGVRLSIAPAKADAKVSYKRWDIPSLGELGLDGILPQVLRPAGDPDVMTAMFDVTCDGTFESVCHDKAQGAVLTIDPGPAPKLVAAMLGIGTETSIGLETDAVIQIQHVARHHRPDHGSHFFLHYLIGGKELPENAKDFQKECRGGPTLSGPIGLGPDCSNSGYP